MSVPAIVTSQLNRFTPRSVYLVPKSNVARPIASKPVIQNAVTLGGSATPPTTNPMSAQAQVIGGSPVPSSSGLGLGNLSQATGWSKKHLQSRQSFWLLSLPCFSANETA